MAEIVYLLCALTSVACAILLYRNYRPSGVRLTLWTSLCFAILAVQNLLLLIDLVLFPGMQLTAIRNGVGLIGGCVLLAGLIWESV